MTARKSLARITHRFRQEQGLSLVEMVVATVILGVVLLIFLTTFASIQGSTQREEERNRNNDQARLAVEELDREIRSGNVLYDPACENGTPESCPDASQVIASCAGCLPGYTLRVYTQSNAPTRAGFTCRLWRITTTQELQTQSWPPLHPEQATAWRTVATGVVNRLEDKIAFVRTSDPSRAERTVDVHLYVNGDYTHDPGDTVQIEVSLTGRNTLFDYPQNVCDEVPPS